MSVATGITAVLNAPLAGTNGLSLTGNGTLTLGTASTALTGDVSIGAGSTLKVTGLNTNGSFASSPLAWASLGYAANTESVGPFSVFGPTNAGTGIAVTTNDVCRAATRLFRGAPTLATMGPAERVPVLGQIAEKLAA